MINKTEKKQKSTLIFIVAYLVFASMLDRMTFIGYAHSSQFMEWQNLGITTLNHATCAPNVF